MTKTKRKPQMPVRSTRLVMRPGLKVWTETTSGQPILCKVIEADWLIKGEWLLNSPAHGYAIQRHHTECQAA
jgi:hypothetical protein